MKGFFSAVFCSSYAHFVCLQAHVLVDTLTSRLSLL